MYIKIIGRIRAFSVLRASFQPAALRAQLVLRWPRLRLQGPGVELRQSRLLTLLFITNQKDPKRALEATKLASQSPLQFNLASPSLCFLSSWNWYHAQTNIGHVYSRISSKNQIVQAHIANKHQINNKRRKQTADNVLLQADG